MHHAHKAARAAEGQGSALFTLGTWASRGAPASAEGARRARPSPAAGPPAAPAAGLGARRSSHGA
eukprot:4390952-Pyramimonas_sp.AAC.1